MNRVKIGVVGAGAIGGVVSAMLAEKGYDVEVAKRYNSDIVLDDYVNLEISGAFGNRNVLVKAVNGVEGFTSKKDVILVLTRAYDAPAVARQCLKYLKPGGIIVSSQNVMNVEQMLNVVGTNRLFALIINWTAVRHNKATMEVTRPGNMIIGNFGNESSAYLEIMQSILSSIAPTEVSQNIIGDIWSRTIINSIIGSLGALTGYNLRKTMLIPNAKKLMTKMIFESMTLANELQVDVKNYGALDYYQFIERGFSAWIYRRRILRRLQKQNGDIVSSLMTSIENNVKSEIEYLNGYFIRISNSLNIIIPVNHRVYYMVKEIESGNRGMFIDNLMDGYLINPRRYEQKLKNGVVEDKNDNWWN